MLVSIGILPIQSPDYKDLVTSLESQLCDEGNDQEKVCCRNKVAFLLLIALNVITDFSRK